MTVLPYRPKSLNQNIEEVIIAEDLKSIIVISQDSSNFLLSHENSIAIEKNQDDFLKQTSNNPEIHGRYIIADLNDIPLRHLIDCPFDSIIYLSDHVLPAGIPSFLHDAYAHCYIFMSNKNIESEVRKLPWNVQLIDSLLICKRDCLRVRS